MNKDWKDGLLNSGAPLEKDVKEYLDSKEFISNFDYSYLRYDENQKTTKEFSFDILSLGVNGEKFNHFTHLMVECKYRHENTNWVFIPETNKEFDIINSIMNPNDYFCEKLKFKTKDSLFTHEIPPLCSKGIELLGKNNNDKSLKEAFSQLSYAFANIIIDEIEHQVDRLLGDQDVIFFNIPIVVTTANLYLIHENTDIQKIKASESISEIADKYDILIAKKKVSTNLKNYSLNIFHGFIKSFDEKKLERSNSSGKMINQLFNEIADNCPETFVIIHFSDSGNGFEKLFKLVEDVINIQEKLQVETQNRK